MPTRKIKFTQISKLDPSSNALHFKNSDDIPNIKHWNEWWYANFHGANSKLSAWMGISMNRDDKASVFLYCFGNDSIKIENSYPVSLVDKKDDNYNIRIEKNHFEFLPDGNTKIHLESQDNSTKIDLIYKKITCGFVVNANIMTWTVFSPLSEVTGVISYDHGKKKEIIKGVGYQEHVCGVFNIDKAMWDWGCVSTVDNEVSVVFVNAKLYKLSSASSLFLATDQLGIVKSIKESDVKLNYIKLDKSNNNTYPTQEKLKIYNRNLTANIDIHIHKRKLLGALNECLSEYSGEISTDKNTYKIEGSAFAEHKTCLKTGNFYYIMLRKIDRMFGLAGMFLKRASPGLYKALKRSRDN